MNKRNAFRVINLTKEQERAMKDEILAYYQDVKEEEIGIIGQEQILNLFMDHLAPIIYNKALDDAMGWYKSMQDNMSSDFYSLYKNAD